VENVDRESWLRFSKAIEYYESVGFRYQDVPWRVSPEFDRMTRPDWCQQFIVKEKALVGSAEQSFLSIYNELDTGLYYSITPCFRDEVEDELHQVGFMKLELFSRNINNFEKIVGAAEGFFRRATNNKATTVDVVHAEKDILVNGIEVGSYMIRYKDGYNWTCGTGLAEPRLTKALRI
jgi:hypothetical protein